MFLHPFIGIFHSLIDSDSISFSSFSEFSSSSIWYLEYSWNDSRVSGSNLAYASSESKCLALDLSQRFRRDKEKCSLVLRFIFGSASLAFISSLLSSDTVFRIVLSKSARRKASQPCYCILEKRISSNQHRWVVGGEKYEEVLCTLGCVTINLGKNTTLLQSMFVLRVYIQPTHDRTAQSSSLSEMHRELGGSHAAIPVQVKKVLYSCPLITFILG